MRIQIGQVRTEILVLQPAIEYRHNLKIFGLNVRQFRPPTRIRARIQTSAVQIKATKWNRYGAHKLAILKTMSQVIGIAIRLPIWADFEDFWKVVRRPSLPAHKTAHQWCP